MGRGVDARRRRTGKTMPIDDRRDFRGRFADDKPVKPATFAGGREQSIKGSLISGSARLLDTTIGLGLSECNRAADAKRQYNDYRTTAEVWIFRVVQYNDCRTTGGVDAVAVVLSNDSRTTGYSGWKGRRDYEITESDLSPRGWRR